MNTEENKNSETVKIELQKKIEDHRAIATHLETAVKHHYEAIKHHESGNTDMASQSTFAANDQVALANKIQLGGAENRENKQKDWDVRL